jgi:hypothetical protein
MATGGPGVGDAMGGWRRWPHGVILCDCGLGMARSWVFQENPEIRFLPPLLIDTQNVTVRQHGFSASLWRGHSSGDSEVDSP